MGSTFPRNGQIEMSSLSHTVDIMPETGFRIDKKSLSQPANLKSFYGFGYGHVNWTDRLAKDLKTDTRLGICGENEEGIARRQAVFGSNTYVNPPTESFFHFVRHALKDLAIIILLSCAALSLGFGMKVNGAKEGWIDGLSIFLTVCLVILVSATCNYRRHRQFNQLLRNCNDIRRCNVVRDGEEKQISISQVVVGDIVVLNIGDQVPADGVQVVSRGLPVQVIDHGFVRDIGLCHPVFSGTKVFEGCSQILVTSVGVNTEWGKSMLAVSHNSNKQSHLQDRLDKLNWWNSRMSLIVTVLVTIVMFVCYFTGNTKDENGSTQFKGSKTNIHQVLNCVFSIIRATVTIQKGLPMTLKLAYSAKKMLEDKIEEMKHTACERLGCADTIIISRTGSLTMNKIEVIDLRIGLGKEPMGKYSYSEIVPDLVKILQEGITCNNKPRISDEFNLTYLEMFGRPAEEAIISWARQNLKIGEKLRHHENYSHSIDGNVRWVLIRRSGDDTYSDTVHWNGDAETILTMCSSYYDASEEFKIKDLGKNQEVEFKEIIHDAEARGLRCIAFAHKQLTDKISVIPRQGLILTGLIFIKNPCRPDVKNTIKDFQSAGVNIKMITTDNVFKAKAFARECGILRDGMSETVVRKAEEFQMLSEEERMAICVLAEASSPSHKVKMVKYLQEKGQVVAATEDGSEAANIVKDFDYKQKRVDHLLALKAANIGIFMGDHVSSDAKNSSDIIVKDFASIFNAFMLGRSCVYNNTQKVIQFQLTANLSALLINFVAALSETEVPLKAIPLLWTNLVIDTLGALALATEGPTNELTRVRPTEPIITNMMWGNILSQAFYQTAVLLVLQFRGKSIFNVNGNIRDTLTFNTFILCQIFNMFNSRKLEKKNVFEGIHRNKLFLGIISLSLVLQVLMLEFLNKYTDTERLNWVQWSACLGLAALSWPIGCVVKFAVKYWFKEKIVISFQKKRS